MALYPELHEVPPDLWSGDPRAVLAGWIDAAVAEMSNYTLALRLAREVGLTPTEQATAKANLASHIDFVAKLARGAAPHLDVATSRELASAMISIASGPAVTGVDIDPASLRHQLQTLLQGYGLVV